MPGSKQPEIAAFFTKTHKRPFKAAQQGTRLSGCKRKDRQDAADVLLMHHNVGYPVPISCLCRNADADDSNPQAVSGGEQAPPNTGSGGIVKQKGSVPCRKSFTQMHLDAGQVCPAYVHLSVCFLADLIGCLCRVKL